MIGLIPLAELNTGANITIYNIFLHVRRYYS